MKPYDLNESPQKARHEPTPYNLEYRGVNNLEYKKLSRKVGEPMKNLTFNRTWKNAITTPPKEGGRYWCLVEEITDLSVSQFQWNCSYHEIEKRWSDDKQDCNVIYWTELAPMP